MPERTEQANTTPAGGGNNLPLQSSNHNASQHSLCSSLSHHSSHHQSSVVTNSNLSSDSKSASPTKRKRNLRIRRASKCISKIGRAKSEIEKHLLLLGKQHPITFFFVCLVAVWMVSASAALLHIYHTSSSEGGAGASIRKPTTTPFLRASGVHSHQSIPLPLPKEKVSVILTNFNRPKLIRDSSMMRTLLSHPSIDEVLLLHANSHTAFEFVHNKVINIDAIEENEEMGLGLKYYYCQFTKNKWVLHLDDDIEFTTDALNELFVEFGRNPRRLVGRYGRNISKKNKGYEPKDVHKSAEVILSRLMVMERDTCSAFFKYSYLLWNDVILQETEGPIWNGDDIFMSLVANHVYGLNTGTRNDKNKLPGLYGQYNNYAMDWLDVWDASEDTEIAPEERYDITDGFDGLGWWEWRWWQNIVSRNRQYAYRGRLWSIAKQRLKDLKEDDQSS